MDSIKGIIYVAGMAAAVYVMKKVTDDLNKREDRSKKKKPTRSDSKGEGLQSSGSSYGVINQRNGGKGGQQNVNNSQVTYAVIDQGPFASPQENDLSEDGGAYNLDSVLGSEVGNPPIGNTVPVQPTDAISSLNQNQSAEFEKYDMLILYGEDDEKEAKEYRQHLEQIPGIHNIKAVFFDEFCPHSQGVLSRMQFVFDHCRFVFIFVTENFTAASLERFQSEIALIDSISNFDKHDRIIPVWTTENHNALPELSPLVGTKYYNRFGDDNGLDTSYCIQMRNLVRHGRQKYFPGL